LSLLTSAATKGRLYERAAKCRLPNWGSLGFPRLVYMARMFSARNGLWLAFSRRPDSAHSSKSRVTLSRLWCYAGIRRVLPGRQSRRCPEAHRQGQPLQSGARNAKNAPESAICGVLLNRPAPTGSGAWLVPISSPRSAPRRVGRTNLRSDALSVDPFICSPPPPISQRPCEGSANNDHLIP